MLDARSVGHIARNLGKVFTINEHDSLMHAIDLFKTHKVGCLVVVDEKCKMSGIISERDIIISMSTGNDFAKAKVFEAMTSDVVSCDLNTNILDALSLMTAKGVRHLPVVSDGVAIGMLSSTDITAHQLSANKAMQTAATQVAKLSGSFKSLDFNQVLDLVTREVPAIFGANCGALVIREECPGTARVVSRSLCHCCDEHICGLIEASSSSSISLLEMPEECRYGNNSNHRAVFRLPIYDVNYHDNSVSCTRHAYLCMCRFNSNAMNSRELLSYKATLLREILAVNLMNTRLYEQARKESQLDGLTGVYTRRVFEDRLEKEYLRSQRYNHPFCLAIFDVDRFKRINDTLGHCVGDSTLRTLAHALGEDLRKTDVLARFGGDEFVLLMPECTIDRAESMLARMRENFRYTIPDLGPVTFSCGIAQWTLDPADTSTDVLRRADASLYAAKRAGRNRTETCV